MSSSNGSVKNGSTTVGTKHHEVMHNLGDGVAAVKKIKMDSQSQQNGQLLDGKTFKGDFFVKAECV